MSYKDDALAQRIEEQQQAYVASQLELDPAELADHPFEIQEDMQQGVIVSWTVYWQEEAPEGVETESVGGNTWTTIPAPPQVSAYED